MILPTVIDLRAGNLTTKKIAVFDLTPRATAAMRRRRALNSRLDNSAAGSFHRIPTSSVTAQGEAQAGADLRIADSALVVRWSGRQRADEAT